MEVNNGDTSLDLWEVGGITGSLSVTSVSHNCDSILCSFTLSSALLLIG